MLKEERHEREERDRFLLCGDETFWVALVFRSVWRSGEVRNVIGGKKFVIGFVFPTITIIKSDDLSIDVFFDESFE